MVVSGGGIGGNMLSVLSERWCEGRIVYVVSERCSWEALCMLSVMQYGDINQAECHCQFHQG